VKVLTADEFHGDEWVSGSFSKVKDAADVGVRNLPCQANLLVEVLDAGLVLIKIGEQLQGDSLIQGEIKGSVDLSRASTTQDVHDPVAAGQQGIGSEPAARAGLGPNSGDCIWSGIGLRGVISGVQNMAAGRTNRVQDSFGRGGYIEIRHLSSLNWNGSRES
jgi:hypothetical protein